MSFIWVTLLLNIGNQEPHEYVYWEFTKGKEQKLFSQAIRKGKWKAYLELDKPMEIFNLEEDPYEENDLTSQQPDIVKEMERIIGAAHLPIPEMTWN